MLKVKVVDTFTENRRGKTAAGKDYNFNQQTNMFVELGGETRRMPRIVPDGQQPLAAGLYEIDVEKHLTVDRFNNLCIEPYARFEYLKLSSAPLNMSQSK